MTNTKLLQAKDQDQKDALLRCSLKRAIRRKSNFFTSLGLNEWTCWKSLVSAYVFSELNNDGDMKPKYIDSAYLNIDPDLA